MRSWLPPFRIELTAAAQWDDVAFFGTEFLLCNRATHEAADVGLTGLGGLEPVEIAQTSGALSEPPLYRRVSLSIGAVGVDEDLSDVDWVDREACDWCRGAGVDAIRGFVLDDESTDDLFFARDLPGVPIVSERFKDAAEVAGWTNVAFVPTESYTWQ